MAIYVLVHGVLHDGECWNWVAELLRAKGHTVHSPSLPVTAGTTFQDHVDFVAKLCESMPEPVLLVGHSNAGAVVTAVSMQAPKAVQALILLDSVVPIEGMSTLQRTWPRWLAALIKRKPFMEAKAFEPAAFGVTRPDRAAWLKGHLRAQPMRTMSDPFPHPPRFPEGRSHYIECTEPLHFGNTPMGRISRLLVPARLSERFAGEARKHGMETIALPLGHDAMLIDEHKVSEALLSIGARYEKKEVLTE
jgi:pimeloyl-ACP methyl ester carboxylesterase